MIFIIIIIIIIIIIVVVITIKLRNIILVSREIHKITRHYNRNMYHKHVLGI